MTKQQSTPCLDSVVLIFYQQKTVLKVLAVINFVIKYYQGNKSDSISESICNVITLHEVLGSSCFEECSPMTSHYMFPSDKHGANMLR